MTIEVHPASEIVDFYPDDDRSISEKFGHFLAAYFEIEVVDKSDNFIVAQAGIISGQRRTFFDGRLVKSVDYEEDVENADQMKIVVINPELRLSNSNIFALGNSMDLFIGYDDRPRMYMGRGIITEVTPDYNDSEPTITILGNDISYFMMDEQRAEIVPDGSRWWQSARTGELPARDEASDEPIHGDPVEATQDPGDPRYPIKRGVRTNDTRVRLSQNPQFDRPSILNEEQRARNPYLPRNRGHRGEVRAAEEASVHLETIDIVGDPRQFSLQQQRFGRRRDAGHVWSGLSDSDIVIAIFRKYHVVPYIELTRESRFTYQESDDEENNPDLATEDAGNNEIQSGDLSDGPDRVRTENYPIKRGVRTEDTRAWFASNYQDYDFEASPIMSARQRERNPILRAGRERFRPHNTQAPATVLPTMEIEFSPRERTQRRVVQKAGTSDWAFLQELAKKHGYICFTFFDYETRQWIGYWGPEENVPQTREFIFRYNAGRDTTLKSFRPSSSIKNQSTEIDLIYVDPINRRENRLRVAIEGSSPNYTADESESPDPIGDGPEVVLEVNGQRATINASHRFTSAEDARQWLVSYWRRYASDFQVVEGETLVGIPELKARQYHRFEGVQRDSGRYFVTSARHAMSESGYALTFTCRRTPANVEENGTVTVESEEMNRHEPDPVLATT